MAQSGPLGMSVIVPFLFIVGSATGLTIADDGRGGAGALKKPPVPVWASQGQSTNVKAKSTKAKAAAGKPTKAKATARVDSRSRETNKMKKFDEKNPFPKYGDLDLKSCEEIPTIEIEDVKAMMNSYEAAYKRADVLETLRKKTQLRPAAAKAYYWRTRRTCKTAFGPPSPPPPDCNTKHTAIILTGQTRSFLNARVQGYWMQTMGAIRQAGSKPVILAVLDEHSLSPGRAGVPRVAHNDSQTRIRERLAALAQDRQVVFLSGNGSMVGHASKVKNDRLRKMLTPWNQSDARMYDGGSMAGFMKWVIGLDMLLDFERAHPKVCFSHVLRARPDFLFMAWTTPQLFRTTFEVLTDAAYFVNDQSAVMPREIAGAYFTTIAVWRGLHGLRSKWGKFLQRKVHTDPEGGLLPPGASLAYHGRLFAGVGFDLPGGYVPYAGYDDVNNLGGFFVREDLSHGACVDSDEAAKRLQMPVCDYLH